MIAAPLDFAEDLDQRVLEDAMSRGNHRFHQMFAVANEELDCSIGFRIPIPQMKLVFSMDEHLKNSVTTSMICEIDQLPASGNREHEHQVDLLNEECIDSFKFLIPRINVNEIFHIWVGKGFKVPENSYLDDLIELVFSPNSSTRNSLTWNRSVLGYLQGYYSPELLKRMLPRFKSRNIFLDVKFEGVQKPNYTYFIVPQSKMLVNKGVVHFTQNVEQKFETVEDFQILASYVMANPQIKFFSFTSEYEKFSFESFYEVLSDFKFKIPDQTISLNFFFWSHTKNQYWKTEYNLVDPLNDAIQVEKEVLADVLFNRNRFGDCIRCRFQTGGRDDCKTPERL